MLRAGRAAVGSVQRGSVRVATAAAGHPSRGAALAPTPRWSPQQQPRQVRWQSAVASRAVAVQRAGGLQCPFPDVEIPDVNLAQFILQGAQRFGDRVAFRSATDPDDTMTFSQTADLARSIGKRFMEEGLKKGETVMIYLPNCHQYVPTILGIVLAGGVCSLTNPGYGERELAHQLETSRSKWLVTSTTQLDGLLAANDKYDPSGSGVERVWTIDSGDAMWTPSPREGEGGEAWPSVDPDDVCLLPFSSGTSGLPKGVMLTHRSIVANCIQTQSVEEFGPHNVFIAVLPTFHIFGFLMTMLGLAQGAEQRTMSKFDMAVYLKMMATGANCLHVVPPIAVGLSKYLQAGNADCKEWGVKSIMVGAAPLSANTENLLKDAFGCAVKQGYGMTELSPVSHFTHPSYIKQGSIGFLVPNTEAQLRHPETGVAVPQGEEGEIWVKGPQVMKGYMVAPTVTEDPNAHAFQDGWFKTGDIGRVDSEGYWFITDRVKELIKYKGYQVAPAELESELLTHESITDALVFAVPGPEGEEHARALVVKREGAEMKEGDVSKYIADRLASHKQLRGGVIFTDSVPKSASGKLLRREARAKYSQ